MKPVCVIPARGGSRRIPGKNIRLFHGKPIIAYSIETAKASGLFKEVWVSTDDHAIAQVALDHGALFFPRAKHLALDEIGTQDVTRDFLKAGVSEGGNPEYTCCLYATAPLLQPEFLIAALDVLLRCPETSYIYATDLRWEGAGQFYLGKTKAFLGSIPLAGNSIKMPLEDKYVCDINTEQDWLEAESLYRQLHRGEVEIDLAEGSRA